MCFVHTAHVVSRLVRCLSTLNTVCDAYGAALNDLRPTLQEVCIQTQPLKKWQRCHGSWQCPCQLVACRTSTIIVQPMSANTARIVRIVQSLLASQIHLHKRLQSCKACIWQLLAEVVLL